jgi:hypothetical protein
MLTQGVISEDEVNTAIQAFSENPSTALKDFSKPSRFREENGLPNSRTNPTQI